MKRTFFFGMNKSDKQYWTAFYTKPRSEKKVASRLIKQGFNIYCPTRTVVKQWSDRKKKVSEPVFTSYIFAKVNELSRSGILKDPAIVSNVFWLGSPALIREQEILEIKSFLEDFPLAEMIHRDFKQGDKIKVDSGPFSGEEGVIRRVQDNRVFLIIASLGIEINAEMSITYLKK